MNENIVKGNEIKGKFVVESLKRRGFEAEYVSNREEALKRILEIIPKDATVGIPGTVTIREIGAMDALQERGNKIFQHWGQMSKEERRLARFKENEADVFLTSANAITQDGEIINIDGTGNRVAGMAWGNGLVLFVVGINKISFDLTDGIKRARSATIPNAVRQNEMTACRKAGHCVKCLDEASMCRAILILEQAVKERNYHVILVGENLGY
ncbi:MAG: lactate utilization protein [Synergistaceae bacterium]|nr:lactate utilization protein [Synergistaceae bacterium]MBQ6434725.1 lactate utilization protein [Synergistaceae bacterium]MBQ6736893.1 lactate utilization protein [Synergistaceae bacterium]MBQ7068553.1 lactate utilization protein [Synergistaceae bacterium]MBR0075057.1 lactate utilization protein [Synergistaceae bacterium]